MCACEGKGRNGRCGEKGERLRVCEGKGGRNGRCGEKGERLRVCEDKEGGGGGGGEKWKVWGEGRKTEGV